MTATVPDWLATAIAAAARAVPPAWPLAESVAVNPFLGQSDEDLATTAVRLSRAGGVAVTMPRAWYAARIEDGRITDGDLAAALAAAPAGLRAPDVAALKVAAAEPAPEPRALPTLAGLAADAEAVDWPAFVEARLGAFCADHFDTGQALWSAEGGDGSPWRAWRRDAMHDLTPEIAGLPGFAARIAATPEEDGAMIARAAERLGLSEATASLYFHRLLTATAGWAQAARWRDRQSGTDTSVTGLLAICLAWEEALSERADAAAWAEARAAYAEPVAPTRDSVIDAVLQEAAERAGQRDLADLLAAPAPERDERPAVQAAFCIDVRSEVFRRGLEATSPSVQTLGFAGFFGLSIAHRRHGSDVVEPRCPVLLAPSVPTRAGGDTAARRAQAFSDRIVARASRAWGRFKLAAVSSFAFVEASGPVYVHRLLRDALGLGEAMPAPEPAPVPDPALPFDARLGAAETVLRAMSLTRGFAPVVLLTGHGAGVVNNPHASALACGACGGYAGDANARLLAGLLNDPEVRVGLIARGIDIPDDTLFVAGLHDTTADTVTLFDVDRLSKAATARIAELRRWLDEAGALARAERAGRLPHAGEGGAALLVRGRNWAEPRPEWGLAGCRAFIAAPRARTAPARLDGRVFLHGYDWRADEGFGVLELILTAPVVVASWISLQYYGSTVAPSLFGAGDKLLHNVVGGMGVVEGNGGRLRTGLPWQSVHDGEASMHEPLRLTVAVEAPREAIADILSRHAEVRALFDNGWLHLFAMDDAGALAWRYAGDLTWTPAFGRAEAPAGAMSVAAE